MASIYEEIGDRIAALRRVSGWSQEQLAERVDLNASYLARIEGGARKATIDTLGAIASALGVSINALLPHDEPTSLPSELIHACRGLSDDDLLVLAKVARRFARVAPARARRRPSRS